MSMFLIQGLEPYSNHKAAGMRLLQGILKGELAKTDTYWAHAPLSKEERANVLLITNKSVKQQYNILFIDTENNQMLHI